MKNILETPKVAHKSNRINFNSLLKGVVIAICFLFLVIVSSAQDRSPARGFQAGNSYSMSDIETVNLTNGNLMLNIPLASLAGGRGTASGLTVGLQYNGKIWNGKQERRTDGNPDPNNNTTYMRELLEPTSGGWSLNSSYQMVITNRLDLEEPALCAYGNEYQYTRNGYTYKLQMSMPGGGITEFRPYGNGVTFTDINNDGYFSIDQNGTRHIYALSSSEPDQVACNYTEQQVTTTGMNYYSTDGSNIRLFIPYGLTNNNKWKMYFPDGRLVENQPSDDPTVFQRMTDRNGNKLFWRSATLNGISGVKIENEVGQYVFLGNTIAGTMKIIQPGFGGELLETSVHFKQYTVHRKYKATSAFNAPAAFKFEESAWTLEMVDKITLPTQAGGLEYNFTYNASETPPETGNYTNGWGELKSLTLPSTAKAEYSYVIESNSTSINNTFVLDRRVFKKDLIYQNQNDGNSATAIETTFYAENSSTAPDGGIYLEGTNQNPYFKGYAARINHPNGTITEKLWANNAAPRVTGNTVNAYVKTEFTSIPDAAGNPVLTLTKDYDYDKNGNVLEIREYDWVPYSSVPRSGSGIYLQPTGLPSGLVLKRKTINTYYNQAPGAGDTTTDSVYIYANPSSPKLKNVIKSTEIQSAAGVPVSRSEFIYDDPDNLGNLTETRTWDSYKNGNNLPYSNPLTSTNSISTTVQYDIYGNPTLTTDTKGNQTQIIYGAVNGYTGLYPTQTVTAYGTSVARTSTAAYDFYTGLATSITDVDNNLTSGTEYDALGRPTKVKSAVGTSLEVWTQTVYDDLNRTVIVKADVETKGDAKKVATQFYDQLGRVRLSKTLEDSQNQSATNETDGIKVQTRYLTTGNGYTYALTSNPYRASTSSAATAEESMGWTRSKTYKDGKHSEVETFAGATLPQPFLTSGYNTNSTGKVQTDLDADRTLVTDQSGKQRMSKTNALGQLIDVWEITAADSSTEAITFGSPQQNLNGYKTSYQYDALNNLTTVSQGAQTRSFTYSSLSRLKTATNPESGTIAYVYDNNGNLTTKTDARGVVTTYGYDALNRVLTRSYANEPTTQTATPLVTYTYDNLTNAKGKLIKVTTGNVATPFSITEYTEFDQMGRVKKSKQTTDGVAYNEMEYGYNLSGALIEQKYPSGRVVKNVLDNDGDLSMVKSKRDASSGFWNYAKHFTYTAAGAVSSMQLGNGRWESTQFNSRLQPTQIALGNVQNATNLLDLDYSYGTTQNNGNVLTQTINVPTETGNNQTYAAFTATQTFTYDSLNRIKQATETVSGQTGNSWQQSFQYDRFGNRTFDEANTTTLPKNCGTAPNLTVCAADRKIYNPTPNTSDNRFSTADGYTFDSSGNTTKDAQLKKFTYDGENKQIKVETLDLNGNVTGLLGEYWYDGDGKRVKKYVPSTGETTIFIYDASGKMVAEYSTLVATPTEAKTSYLTTDHLGSPRINTDQNGTVTARQDYQPFGEEIARASYGNDDVRKQFTSYERDNESGLDFAQARMFGYNHGRFTSPDPARMLGARMGDPQHWNLYVYARNNPLILIDITGEFPTFSFSLHVRAFAPFKEFGLGNIAKGDDRGFSTDLGATYRISSRTEITADGSQNMKYNLATTYVDPPSTSTTDIGIYSWSKESPSHLSDGDVQSGDGLSQPTDSLTAHNYGNNSALPGSPDIDLRSNFNWSYKEQKDGSVNLTVSGTVTGDQFPAAEAFIRDSKGNGVFLGVFATPPGSGPETSLPGNNRLPMINANVTVQVKNGVFTGVLENGKLVSLDEYNKRFTSQPAAQ